MAQGGRVAAGRVVDCRPECGRPRLNLPFAVVSDAAGSRRKEFGVPKTLGILPGRVTYVIDRQGIVRHMFDSQFAADRHVAEALAVVRQLAEN